MKKALSILFSIVLMVSLFACKNDVSSNEGPDEPTPEPGPGPTPSEKNSNVVIKNDTIYDVNIYVEKSPYYEISPDFTVKAKTSYGCKLPVSTDTVGTIFYIEYLIDIGNAKFPYRTLETQGYKYLLIKENEKAELVIDSLNKCESNSAYFYIENDTDSSIHVINGMSFVAPVGTKDYNIPAGGGAGVFEVNESTTAISFGNYSFLRVELGEEKYYLPIESDDIQKGNIYSFVLSTDSSKSVPETLLSLKSVTPFNIDTQKQIWSRYTSPDPINNTTGKLDVEVVRPRRDVKNGYLACCSATGYPNALIMKSIDVYGDTKSTGSVGLQYFDYGNYRFETTSIVCADFLETSDGSCAILADLMGELVQVKKGNEWVALKEGDEGYRDENAATYFFIYNFESTKVKLALNVSQYQGDSYWEFGSGQNVLIEMEEGEYALAGFSYTEEVIKDLIVKIDTNKIVDGKPDRSIYESSDSLPRSTEKQRAVTSLFYSKKDNALYATEYPDWDVSYTQNVVYTGRLLKFAPDLTFDSVVLEKENLLFQAISGDSETGRFYICGESYSSGVQKGFLISSSKIANGSISDDEYYEYKAKDKPFAWFESVCICGNNIVATGNASAERDAYGIPVVVSFSPSGKLQWENVAYTNYKNAKSCYATGIGTYLIHLVGETKDGKSYSTIVSADLLGNDTGNTAGLK